MNRAVFVLAAASMVWNTALAAARSQSGCVPSVASAVFPPVTPTVDYALGVRVAVSGNGRYLAASATGHIEQGVQCGAAWVVDLESSGGTGAELLLPSSLLPCQLFGYSLDISHNGDVVVVGSFAQCGTLGRARIYRRIGGVLTPTLNLVGATQDMFGFDVSISGDGNTVVVASPGWYSGFIDQGAIFTYDWTGSSWIQSSVLYPNMVPLGVGGMTNNVELSGDGQAMAFTTAWHPADTVRNGAVYVMRRSGSGWSFQARLQEPVAYSISGFGIASALNHDGSILAVGNWNDSRLAEMQGAVTIFRNLQTGWSYDNVILPTLYAVATRFGTAVDLDATGTKMVASAPGHGPGLGRVEYLTAPAVPGANWSLAMDYVPTGPATIGAGRSVSMSANAARWVASEPWSDVYGLNAGRVVVFEAPCLNPTVYCTAQTNTLGCAAQIAAQGTPSVSSSSGFVIAASNVRNQQNGMLIYSTNGRAQIAWQGGTLCVGLPLRRTPLVSSGGSAAPALDCSGVLARDFNTWAIGANDPALFAGQQVQAQFYSRDPGSSANINLSNALEFTLEP